MIEAKELRIGNLICRPDLIGKFNRFETILELGAKATCSGPFKVICEYDEIDPIPFTPEWLERLGFVCDQFFDDIRPVYYINDFYIDFDNLQPQSCGFDIAKVKIKYVHQLQNLFFALTGEELTIKT